MQPLWTTTAARREYDAMLSRGISSTEVAEQIFARRVLAQAIQITLGLPTFLLSVLVPIGLLVDDETLALASPEWIALGWLLFAAAGFSISMSTLFVQANRWRWVALWFPLALALFLLGTWAIAT